MQEAWTSNTEQCSPKQLPVGKTHHMKIADGRYVLLQRIGGGAFGELFKGVDTCTNSHVAIKLERRKTTYPQLSYESKVYRVLHHGTSDPVGIPRAYYYNVEGDYGVLVMELCGPSLDDLFNYCGRRFSVKTVCMLADQMLQRIQFLHEKGFVHQDMKPENFVFGNGKKGHVLHLIDFGLSKVYWNRRTQAHIPFCEGKPLTGTARYCSTWTHRGFEQSRRDDLEAIGFILVYFLVGSLPWQGLQTRDPRLKILRIGEKKIDTPLEKLCHGLPPELLRYCTYCRGLMFTDAPDYAHLRDLFATLARQQCDVAPQPEPEEGVGWWDSVVTITDAQPPQYDWMFDWFVKRKAEVAEWRKRQHARHPNGTPSPSVNIRGREASSAVSTSGAHVMFVSSPQA
ncbi:casein kinase I [Trypanosoma rangeli]|uniref:non-specific serine/threonine protein kinase n=1 Tax=Trypanosoma rangeli TaxID=5698 RepID=A0A422NL83_TRYRA|nr:casein kinase I [Trypanosoma rangeli]RNF06184.1 casein kinase I [Trypanosoma rangeli]|eukprot:RNF06184.1 casein kinase I [Trypanosoma rangeli]